MVELYVTNQEDSKCALSRINPYVTLLGKAQRAMLIPACLRLLLPPGNIAITSTPRKSSRHFVAVLISISSPFPALPTTAYLRILRAGYPCLPSFPSLVPSLAPSSFLRLVRGLARRLLLASCPCPPQKKRRRRLQLLKYAGAIEILLPSGVSAWPSEPQQHTSRPSQLPRHDPDFALLKSRLLPRITRA